MKALEMAVGQSLRLGTDRGKKSAKTASKQILQVKPIKEMEKVHTSFTQVEVQILMFKKTLENVQTTLFFYSS